MVKLNICCEYLLGLITILILQSLYPYYESNSLSHTQSNNGLCQNDFAKVVACFNFYRSYITKCMLSKGMPANDYSRIFSGFLLLCFLQMLLAEHLNYNTTGAFFVTSLH